MASSNITTLLAVLTCLFTLTSVGLTAYHSVGHSYQKDKDSGEVLRSASSNTEFCPSAIKVKMETDKTLVTISCPFKPATKALAFISLILCQFLLILLCCKLKNKVSSMVIMIFAIIVFPLLLVGGILMVVDMINGKKELEKMGTLDLDGYSYQPIEYILDVLFLFFGLITGAIATFFAYTARPASYPNNVRHPSQPTQQGNTSMGMTKPQWTEGESQSQSTDYIKPYGNRGNISTYQAYQGGSAYTSQNASTSYLQTAGNNYDAQNTSMAYPQSNNLNTSTASPTGRGGQPYQTQNERYLESNQNYENTGYGNRRNISYKDNVQTRQRQQSNTNAYNNAGNQGSSGNAYDNNYGITAQRLANRNAATPNNNNNPSYETNANQNHTRNQGYIANNSTPASQNQGNRNYPGSHQNQMYANNNEASSYERSPDSRPYANSGGNRPNKFNSAVNRIGAMRGGVNALENGGTNPKGYLNYGNESSNQGNTNSYSNYDANTNESYSPNNRNRDRSRSNNQRNHEEQQYQEEGNYQRQNQRNTHVSQINGSNIPYNNNNNNGMTRPAANSIGNGRSSANYAGY